MNGFSFGEYSSFRRLIEVFMGLSAYTKPLSLLCAPDAGKCLFYFARAKSGYHTSEENQLLFFGRCRDFFARCQNFFAHDLTK